MKNNIKDLLKFNYLHFGNIFTFDLKEEIQTKI